MPTYTINVFAQFKEARENEVHSWQPKDCLMCVAVAGGDVCVLAAAFFYSLATVRLSRLAPAVPTLPLTTAKSLALSGASLLWLSTAALKNVGPHSC